MSPASSDTGLIPSPAHLCNHFISFPQSPGPSQCPEQVLCQRNVPCPSLCHRYPHLSSFVPDASGDPRHRFQKQMPWCLLTRDRALATQTAPPRCPALFLSTPLCPSSTQHRPRAELASSQFRTEGLTEQHGEHRLEKTPLNEHREDDVDTGSANPHSPLWD